MNTITTTASTSVSILGIDLGKTGASSKRHDLAQVGTRRDGGLFLDDRGARR
jgi:hypothetical protein